jgi:hypothetical protein
MDPYLESQGFWQDFHTTLLPYCRRALRAVLPRHYAAVIEERISLVDLSQGAEQIYRPDVAVISGRAGAELPAGRGASATLEPITLPLALEDLEEIHHRWIEIKRLPDRSLVTVIEILSPTNKIGSRRIEYLEKRAQWLRQPVNVVEVDLLLGGRRLPMRGPLPAGDCYALVSRSGRRPNCDVYAWSIRRALPEIPIPLAERDSDIALNLAAVFAQTYDDAGYDDLVDYSAPLALPLAPEDRDWVEDQARGFAERSGRGH